MTTSPSQTSVLATDNSFISDFRRSCKHTERDCRRLLCMVEFIKSLIIKLWPAYAFTLTHEGELLPPEKHASKLADNGCCGDRRRLDNDLENRYTQTSGYLRLYFGSQRLLEPGSDLVHTFLKGLLDLRQSKVGPKGKSMSGSWFGAEGGQSSDRRKTHRSAWDT